MSLLLAELARRMRAGAPEEPTQSYDQVVTGLSGGAPLTYWRFSNAGAIIDEMPGERDGTWDGSVTLVSGLPQDSDQATSLPGTVVGTIPHDSGLELSSVSLSLWFELSTLGSDQILFSKDAPGLNNSDYSIWALSGGTLRSQFQSGSAQFPINFVGIETGRAYHAVMTSDGSGHELWVDGKHIGTETGYTSALVDNIQNILFGKAQWSSAIMTGILDEVAFFSRKLTDAEIITLSQRVGAPFAESDSTSVLEGSNVTVDVAALSNYVGRKANLTINITTTHDHGTASVNVDNNLVYEADNGTDGEVETIGYTITDVNGTSPEAFITVNIQETDLGGGTLAYRWQPLGEWIDGVSLSNRSASSVDQLAKWQHPNAATVGSSLPKSILNGGQAGYYFNRAPTGEPCIEIWIAPPASPFYPGAGGNVVNFAIQLWDHLGAGSGPWPRHVRVVMEIKTCKPSDPTTFKGQGKGTLTGSYPAFKPTHTQGTNVQLKYFVGCYAGNFVAGGGNANWWNDHTLPIRRSGLRLVTNQSGKYFENYLYIFDRPGKFGTNPSDTNFPHGMTLEDAGIEGVWHRIEIEHRLTTPSTVPEDAVRNNPAIDPRPHNGDGLTRYYVTKDIDGELGTPGTRTLVDQVSNRVHFPKFDNVGSDDNMHTLATIGGFWLNLIYGGSNSGARTEAWAWMRKVEVYRHDV